MRLFLLLLAAVVLSPLVLLLAALWPALEPLIRARAVALHRAHAAAAFQGARA